MPIPATPEERYAVALEEAWIAAERTNRLLAENNTTTAVVWATAAEAWATIAASASLQRRPDYSDADEYPDSAEYEELGEGDELVE